MDAKQKQRILSEQLMETRQLLTKDSEEFLRKNEELYQRYKDDFLRARSHACLRGSTRRKGCGCGCFLTLLLLIVALLGGLFALPEDLKRIKI